MNQNQAYGSHVITNTAVYKKLWNQTAAKNRSITHALEAEESWRILVYSLHSQNQNNPKALEMARQDIIELKARGVLATTQKIVV